jgi:hypothetical protein
MVLLESSLPQLYHSAVNGYSVYQLIADSILILHGAFIIFVLLGGLIGLFFPRIIWLHLPCALWGIIVELTGWVCPLTRLENDFSARAGATPYGGDCIVHYLEPVIYPEGLTKNVQLLFGAAVLLVNAAVYGLIFLRYRKKN